MELLLVSLASVLAGFVDAIVGGGGLVLVPALFAVFPTTHPATLFGTNKSATLGGPRNAAIQYGRRVDLRRDGVTTGGLKPEGVRDPVAHDHPGGMQIHVPHYVDGKLVGELVMRASDAALVRDRVENVMIALGLSAIAMVCCASSTSSPL